jgi:hypothetical protein
LRIEEIITGVHDGCFVPITGSLFFRAECGHFMLNRYIVKQWIYPASGSSGITLESAHVKSLWLCGECGVARMDGVVVSFHLIAFRSARGYKYYDDRAENIPF